MPPKVLLFASVSTDGRRLPTSSSFTFPTAVGMRRRFLQRLKIFKRTVFSFTLIMMLILCHIFYFCLSIKKLIVFSYSFCDSHEAFPKHFTSCAIFFAIPCLVNREFIFVFDLFLLNKILFRDGQVFYFF